MNPSAAWLGLCAVLTVLSVVLTALGLSGSGDWGQRMAWHSNTWAQNPWTAWSASLVHLSWTHLGANLLGLGAVAALGWAIGTGWFAVSALLMAWPLSNLSLLFWPNLPSCSGLSGLLHAATAILWSFVAITSEANLFNRFLGTMLFSGVTLKLFLEQAWLHPVIFDKGLGFDVLQASHLGGALVGASCGLGFALADLLNQLRRGVSIDKR
jgi:membrane associated rhomboid family serine protease